LWKNRVPELVLYHLPGACSRVTLTALEQVGVPYEDRMVDLMKGQQRSPEYLAVNPRGKIPALLVDGELLAENGAILSWLHMRWPEAGLLPEAANSIAAAHQQADLFSLSSFWHPSVRAMRMPIRWTTGDQEQVREKGRELVSGPIAAMDARLAQQDWWFGAAWSVCDTYFCWNYTTAEEGGLDLSGLAGINAHRARVEAHPPFQRALAREQAAIARSAEHGA
jgi:glutathione S-transferase